MSGLDARRIRLGPGAEFDLIRRFLAAEQQLPREVLVGPGDDAAVLEGGWVVTTDLSIEDVHFRRAWLSDREIGYRAAAGALSDLAAMAASPVGALVSLAAPRGGVVDVEAVHAGIREITESVGAPVIGGDLSSSPGPLVIDVVAVGRTERPVLRRGAEPNDEVWVSGSLGASAAATRVWEAGGSPSPELRERFARPRPRIAEARALAEAGTARALIDLSDGLAGDAGHIAAASGVRITLEASAVPVAPAAVAALGAEPALEQALHGGEDYELCFVARPGAVDALAFARAHGVPLTRVGWVSEGEGVWIHDWEGESHPIGRGGFDHWGAR
ncbi:MAG: thiamine-phosphate kinase [Gemmatimonadales bacterium]